MVPGIVFHVYETGLDLLRCRRLLLLPKGQRSTQGEAESQDMGIFAQVLALARGESLPLKLKFGVHSSQNDSLLEGNKSTPSSLPTCDGSLGPRLRPCFQ